MEKEGNAFWKRILKSAQSFLELSPWEFMYETDVFGLRIPGGEDDFFISVMGSAEEHYAITAYKGMETLNMFFDMQDEESWVNMEEILLMPQVMLSFEHYEELDKEEKAILKASGLKFPTGKFPVLHETIPGLLPQIPDNDKLSEIAVIFEQALHVIKRAKDDIDLILPEDDGKVFMRQNKLGKWIEDFLLLAYSKQSVEVNLNQVNLEQLRNKIKKPKALVVDVRIMPRPTMSDHNVPFFPSVLLILNKRSGIVEHFELLQPFPDYDSMLAEVPEKIISFLVKQPNKPFMIHCRPNFIGDFLSDIGPDIGIQINIKPILREINDAMESLLQYQDEFDGQEI